MMRASSPWLAVSSLLTGLVTNIARRIEVLMRRCRRPIVSVDVTALKIARAELCLFVALSLAPGQADVITR
jgi:hypothetical protein